MIHRVEDRVKRIQSALIDKNLDAALFMNPKNIYYLTGIAISAAYLFVSQSEICIITDSRYTYQLQAEASMIKHYEYSAQRPHFEIVRELGYKSIGFESNYLSLGMVSGLKQMMHFAEWIPFTGVIEKMRMIKDTYEIECLKRAAKISDESFIETLNYIKVGRTEKEIATFLFETMVKKGADFHLSFDIIVASGYRSAFAHGYATNKCIEAGDLLMIDFGCQYQKYTTDTTRTVVIGEPSDNQINLYNHVHTAQKLVLDQMKEGMTNAQAHRISNQYFEQHGFQAQCGNSLGHGIGLDVEDGPVLIDLIPFFGETQLQSNMVVTVEPGIYIPEYGGIRIEDDVVIRSEGIELLTKAPKHLISI